MGALVESRLSSVAQDGGFRPTEIKQHIGTQLLATDEVVRTSPQIFPTGFRSERIYQRQSIEDFRTSKLSLLTNATAVHDRDGNVARLVTSYSDARVTQYLVTDEGHVKFREVINHQDGTKKESMDETIFNSITGAWVVPRSTYGPDHMMYMYLDKDVDGLPNLPKHVQRLYLEQQVKKLERLQKFNEKGEEDGSLRVVKMGLNRSSSVNDQGLRSVYRLHVHSWKNDRNLSPEQAIKKRSEQEGFDGGVSAYLGKQIAFDLAEDVEIYWKGAIISYDEVGASIWLPGFTPQDMLNNGKGVNIIDGLVTAIDRKTDKQLDAVHRTAFASERQDVLEYVQYSCDNGTYSETMFQELFTPRASVDLTDTRYITNPLVVKRIQELRDSHHLRQPAGSAMGIEFIPQGSDVGPAGAHIRLSTVVTKGGGIGTAEITQVSKLEREEGKEMGPEEMKKKIVNVYDRLVDAPPAPPEHVLLEAA